MLKNVVIALFFIVTVFSAQADDVQKPISPAEDVIKTLNPKL
jgi:hypothetical protein